jgi:cytochrome P450
MIFDPYDPSIADDPYPVYAALRRKSPVYHDDRHDFWALSRFADVKRALSDHETFCSSQGLLVLQATDDYEAPQVPAARGVGDGAAGAGHRRGVGGPVRSTRDL